MVTKNQRTAECWLEILLNIFSDMSMLFSKSIIVELYFEF